MLDDVYMIQLREDELVVSRGQTETLSEVDHLISFYHKKRVNSMLSNIVRFSLLVSWFTQDVE